MELIGKIVHLKTGQNLMFKFDLELDLSKYETVDSKCEICDTIRYRKDTYIIRDDNNRLLQVGSNCVKKALGRDIDKKEAIIVNACNNFYDEWRIGIFNTKYMSTKMYLLKLIKFTKNCFDKNVNDRIFDISDHTKIEDLKEYESEYKNLIRFYETNSFNNDFKNNVKNLVLLDMFPMKYQNVIKYAYKVYVDETKHKELVNILKNQESFSDSEDFVIKDINLESSYEDTTYYYKGITYYKYMILTTNNFLLQFDTSSAKDFRSWVGKHCSCEVKKEYISTKNGKVTIIKNLKLIKN